MGNFAFYSFFPCKILTQFVFSSKFLKLKLGTFLLWLFLSLSFFVGFFCHTHFLKLI